MSIYSDYKVGAMSEVEFHNACVTENMKDRAYLEDLAYGEVNPNKMCQNCLFMKYASRAEGKDLCICTYDMDDLCVVEYTDYCDLWESGK